MAPSFPIDIPQNCPFGVHNLPYGIFSTSAEIGLGAQPRAGTAIGIYVLDLDVLVGHGLFQESSAVQSLKDVFLKPTLNEFAQLPTQDRRVVREEIIKLLTRPESPLFSNSAVSEKAWIPLEKSRMHIPFDITDYTDFFSSYVHAENGCRSMGIPIPAPFYEYPMGYNGRLSSIKVSGTDVLRPSGFYKAVDDDRTRYQPSQKLDFEIELGVFISAPIEAGKSVNAKEAADHIFGYVLLNDWSARDIQAYEMAPFGPYHGKSFLTSISPWVVTPDALRGSLYDPPASDSDPKVCHVLSCDPDAHGLYDIFFSASITRNNAKEVELSRTYMKHLYWSHPQMIAYQSSSGCGMQTGDLLGGGTMSSPMENGQKLGSAYIGRSSFGCLSEVQACGHVLPQADGKPVNWLEDGDRLTFEGWFTTTDGKRAGFGGVTGVVLPATPR